MKILFLSGARAEWGYPQPVVDLCREEGVDYAICATNMWMLPEYGALVDDMRARGYNVSDEIYNSLEGHNHYTMAKSMAVFMASFIDTLNRIKPTWLVVSGDRGEQLMGALAGAYTYTPTAHIQAGELSGNIDGVARHAIGKFAHLHFASNQDAADRLKKLGEEEFRIHLVGHPGLDPLVAGAFTKAKDLEKKYPAASGDYLLVVVHPVTEDFESVGDQAEALASALEKFPQKKIWILPNNDAGALKTRKVIEKRRKADTAIFDNIPREDFIGLLKGALCIIGNSSTGLIEAPTFALPAVNIGRRQHLRFRGSNVIDVPFQAGAISEGITKAISEEFRASLQGMENPYGKGDSARKILKILRETPIDDKLLVKRLTY